MGDFLPEAVTGPASGSGSAGVLNSLPSGRPARARRIVLIGNCQMQAMMGLYRRFVAGRTGDVLHHVASYQELSAEGRSAIEQSDLVIEQLFDVKPHVDAAAATNGQPRLLIPMVTAAFLWPFAGQAHPENREYPFLTGGPYGGEAADSYLNRLIVAGVQPDEAVENYMNLDIAKRANLDRLYELILDRQRARDEAANYRLADVIERHFRTEQVFLSPYHPNVRVAISLATQLFEQMDVPRRDIERMQRCVRTSPFPRTELPLHPGVCRHFHLDFVTADRRYRFMHEGTYTFREYALRYMRYEWNPHLEEGMHLVHRGEFELARQRLTIGLERNPRSADGYGALSDVLNRAGEGEAALEAARQAVAIEPECAPLRAGFGSLLREAGFPEQAETQLQAAVTIDPTEPHYSVLLAHLMRQSGKLPVAVDLMRATVDLDPYSKDLRFDLAQFCMEAGDVNGTADALEQALALSPDDIEIRDMLTHALVRLNRLDEAMDVARAAVRLDPNATRSRINLSTVLLRSGRYAEALQEAQAAARNDPCNGQAHGHLGYVLRYAGYHKDAETAFRQAALLVPHDAHFQHELSVVLRAQEHMDGSLAAARRAAELEPENHNRLLHLASLRAEQGDLAGAWATQGRAIALVSDPPSR